ncbi:MAG: ABC transporter permease [Planctomycetes bacterium]|nr:ABC transporter permease [Planctomycetota bacterium]
MGLPDRRLSGALGLLRRPGAFLAVLVGILVLDFVLIQAGGSDALRRVMLSDSRVEARVLEQQIAAYRLEHGLDQPLTTRLGSWFGRLLHFDLGRSMAEPRSVAELIGPALRRSLWLQGPALLAIFLLGVPLGVLLARRARRPDGRFLDAGAYVFSALPRFWLATLLLIYLATDAGLDLFPLEGLADEDATGLGLGARALNRLAHLALPVTALALPGIVEVARLTRQGMLEALGSGHVLAARALGLPERRIVWRHALRQALVPVAIHFGLLLPMLVGGSVVVEQVFNVDGLGSLLMRGVEARDLSLLQGLVLLAALVTLAGFVLADLLVAWLAPGLRGAER